MYQGYGLKSRPHSLPHRIRPQCLNGRSMQGRKMAFDVASVKPNNSGSRPTSNVPLDSQGLFTPTGGLFSAMDFPLLEYTMFAYKLTREQSQAKPGYYSQ